MKFVSALFLGAVAASGQDDEEQFALNLFGINERDLEEFDLEFNSAVLHKDVRPTWNDCIVGIPNTFFSVLDVYGGFDTSHPFALMTNLANPTLAPKAMKRGMTGMLTLKSKMHSCSNVFADKKEMVSYLVSHATFSYLTMQLTSNLMKVFWSLFSTMTALSSAFFNHDFGKLGKACGELAFAIFGSDELEKQLEAKK